MLLFSEARPANGEDDASLTLSISMKNPLAFVGQGVETTQMKKIRYSACALTRGGMEKHSRKSQ